MARSPLSNRAKEAAKLMADDPFLTATAVAEKIGISRTSVLNWKKREDWREYYQKCLDDNWKEYGDQARKQMKELADQGDYRAIEFLLKCNNMNPATKIEGNLQTELVINIIDE